MTDLTGWSAIVSGGGGGIGRPIAIELARHGAAVIVNDLGTTTDGEGASAQPADEVVAEITAMGGAAQSTAMDVSEPEQVRALVDATVSEHGRLDIVVNTAGLIRNGDLTTYTQHDWDRHEGVHIGGHLNLFEAALPHMERHGRGRFVFFTSGSGLLRASSLLSAYGAGKRAIAQLVWSLHPKLPHGVTLNGIAPLAASRMHGERPKERSDAAVWSGLDAMPPARSIAPVVAALVSTSLNGHVLYTNGAEVSPVDPPTAIETIHLPEDADPTLLGAALDAVISPSAEAGTTAGSNLPRLPLTMTIPEVLR